MAPDENVSAGTTIEIASPTDQILQATADSLEILVEAGDNAIILEGGDNGIDLLAAGLPGPPGAIGPGGGSTATKIASGAVGGHRIVRSVDDDHVEHADAATLDHIDDVLGLALNAAADGGDVNVIIEGDVTHVGWSWTALELIYLGLDGQLTQTEPDSPSVFSLPVGFSTSATSMRVRIGVAIQL